MGSDMIALAMPRYGRSIACAAAANAFYAASKVGLRTVLLTLGTSLGIRCFNLLWCEALNSRVKGVKYFAMIHDDVCPEPGWLDVMMEELTSSGADVVSAVIPIKGNTGVTSTALESTLSPWLVRRLTLHEVYALPATFAIGDIPFAERGCGLLMNTGLWLSRIDNEWVEKVCFRDHTRISRDCEGRFFAEDIPEDWDFSRQLKKLGVDVRITRKISLFHERPELHNRGPWGSWKTDEQFFHAASAIKTRT